MRYKPSISSTVTLSTGTPMHMYFDHPNHNGFSPQDHKLAADYHARQSHSNPNRQVSLFHSAQKELHELAAKGKPTQISHVPSDATIDRLPTENKDFWRQKANDTRAVNEQLKRLEPYRMGKVLGDDEPSAIGTESNIKKVFNSAKSLNKSADIQLAKRVEQDRQPPSPALVAEHAESPSYQDMLETVLAKRRAERRGNAGESNGDPRKQISAEQLDKIKEVVGNRSRGTGW